MFDLHSFFVGNQYTLKNLFAKRTGISLQENDGILDID